MLEENENRPTNPTEHQQSTALIVLNTQPKPRQVVNLRLLLVIFVLISLLTGITGVLIGGQIVRKQLPEAAISTPTVLFQSLNHVNDSGELTASLSLPDIAAITEASVVEITTETVSGNSRMRQFVVEGAGSGVIFTSDGYIVTNNHVIDGALSITVRLTSGESYNATLVGADAQTDLAVLKIDAPSLTPAVLGNSDGLKVGDLAVVIGNPLGELGGTVTDGIISALDRQITLDGETMTLLQTNAAINPGNSGGGLFNAKAELVGIVNAKTSGTGIEGLGFVIPIDTVKPVVSSLIENGYVSGRPWLGVQLVDISDVATAMYYRVSQLGVYVANAENNPTFKAGDLILKVGERAVSSSVDIKKILSELSIGDEVTVQVLRDGTRQELNVTIQEITH